MKLVLQKICLACKTENLPHPHIYGYPAPQGKDDSTPNQMATNNHMNKNNNKNNNNDNSSDNNDYNSNINDNL